MTDRNSSIFSGSDLDLVGREFYINELETGSEYCVRVAAKNSIMGTGPPTATSPSTAIPQGFPKPPGQVSMSIADESTLHIEWEDGDDADADIDECIVELYTRSTISSSSGSFHGSQEVIELNSLGLGITGGTFHLDLWR